MLVVVREQCRDLVCPVLPDRLESTRDSGVLLLAPARELRPVRDLVRERVRECICSARAAFLARGLEKLRAHQRVDRAVDRSVVRAGDSPQDVACERAADDGCRLQERLVVLG